MYRDLGFGRDPASDADGVYDLVCGRPYCNLSREPLLQAKNPSHLEYPFADYKKNPTLALDPKADEPAGGFLARLLRGPANVWSGVRTLMRVTSAAKTFAADFRERHRPAVLGRIDRAAAEDVAKIDGPALASGSATGCSRTLVEFAARA